MRRLAKAILVVIIASVAVWLSAVADVADHQRRSQRERYGEVRKLCSRALKMKMTMERKKLSKRRLKMLLKVFLTALSSRQPHAEAKESFRRQKRPF